MLYNNVDCDFFVVLFKFHTVRKFYVGVAAFFKYSCRLKRSRAERLHLMETVSHIYSFIYYHIWTDMSSG